MNQQRKVKAIIILAIIVVIALLTLTISQLVFIAKAKKELNTQKQQIEELNKKLDYYENKNSNESGYDIIITGEVL